jgi:hypothetical protein
MALTVEDGTGLANADAYISIAYADAYHLNMGNTAWVALSGKEEAIRRATAILNGYSWQGRKVKSDQALDFPRSGLVDGDGYAISSSIVPSGIEKACAEFALREAVSPNSMRPDFVATKAEKRVKVDVLEIEYANPAMTAAGAMPVVTIIGSLIKDYLSKTAAFGGGAVSGQSVRS